jgi:hypothetical protein
MNEHIATLVDAIPAQANASPVVQRLGRHCRADFLLEAGEHGFHLSVDHGRLGDVVHGPRPLRAWTFALRGEADAWQRFWEPLPAVGFNDIFAMARYGHLRIEGDVGPLLEHLRFFKEVLALPRRSHREDTA